MRYDDKFLLAHVPRYTRDRVDAAQYLYHFVVPLSLVKKVAAKVKKEKRSRKPSAYFNANQEQTEADGTATAEILVSLSPDLPTFSR